MAFFAKRYLSAKYFAERYFDSVLASFTTTYGPASVGTELLRVAFVAGERLQLAGVTGASLQITS